MRARPALLSSLVVAALVVAGCDGSSSDGAPTPSASASTSAGSSSATASASPSPSVTAFTSSCDDALALTAVSEAAGQPIVGATSFVVGEADRSIGRLAYLNCRYGLPSAGSKVPAVEIGVSLYDSADRATTRVQGTVEDYRSSGSTATDLTVGTAKGTLLVTRGEPRTLVVAQGSRTVAVSMTGAVFTGNDQIAAVAKLALDEVS